MIRILTDGINYVYCRGSILQATHKMNASNSSNNSKNNKEVRASSNSKKGAAVRAEGKRVPATTSSVVSMHSSWLRHLTWMSRS